MHLRRTMLSWLWSWKQSSDRSMEVEGIVYSIGASCKSMTPFAGQTSNIDAWLDKLI